MGMVWVPAHPTGHHVGGASPQRAPGAGGLRWRAGNAAKRPTSTDIDPGEAISLLAVAGFLGACLLGTKPGFGMHAL